MQGGKEKRQGRDRPPTYHVQAWYDEVRYYSYPYSQECNPHCPLRCSGPVCTHYTQLVWATSNRIGCAINVCYNMNVWGMIWTKAVYLVCNYSPPHPAPEIEETNYIEPELEPVRDSEPQPRAQTPNPSPNDNLERSQVVSTEQMCQQVDCETKLRDQCKGTTCNRYECPPGCLDSPGKVVGAGYYDMALSCDTTVALFCPFKKPVRHCPRSYCPRNCLRDSGARVIGTKYYSDKSSICRAAVHAGVIQNESGGYLDVMPVDKRKQYSGSYQNGITSESLLNLTSGKAFRVFAVI
ncbi:Cysteine-rich secretory protein LCCL domain-containing 1 [Liparis tanakae]|uniref:Cysteine-rich secretory protein LCCL domain-containing 1 n=1 Tax=Liparis tanakae TaxID=230148 RepID=A0A4Z2IHT2_9TELE|nr:Cysteine-rich secretory protein LCCL domain-containing 1 [Liparis tanakae]